MKIIFLDFDGVLNNANEMAIHWEKSLRKNNECIVTAMVARVNQIIKATGAKVVVSSTWRRFHSQQELQQMLNAQGFIGEVIGTTPIFNTSRGKEIKFWLSSHSEVSQFVILDDDTDMCEVSDHLVKTHFYGDNNSDGGLQDNHVEQAINILMNKERTF